MFYFIRKSSPSVNYIRLLRCVTSSVCDHFGPWPLRFKKLVRKWSWTKVVMDRCGHIRTDLVMDRSGHGPIWSWNDLVMDRSGPINNIYILPIQQIWNLKSSFTVTKMSEILIITTFIVCLFLNLQHLIDRCRLVIREGLLQNRNDGHHFLHHLFVYLKGNFRNFLIKS